MKLQVTALLAFVFLIGIESQGQKTKSPNTQKITKTTTPPNPNNGSQAIPNDNSANTKNTSDLVQEINAQFDAMNQSIEVMFSKLQVENRTEVTRLKSEISKLDRSNDSLSRKLQQPANLNTDKEGPKGNTPNTTHQVNTQQINQEMNLNNQKKTQYKAQIQALENKFQQSTIQKQKLISETQSQKQKMLDQASKTKDPQSLNKTLQNVINSIQQESSQMIENLK